METKKSPVSNNLSLTKEEVSTIDSLVSSASTKSHVCSSGVELILVENIEDFLKKRSIQSDFRVKIGQYEGGFQIWECTWDLIGFLCEEKKTCVGQRVIDLGCGHGVLGIYALKSGASHVVFQDYNREVLVYCTLPLLILNGFSLKEIGEKFSLVHGSWNQLKLPEADLVLASEVLYETNYYNDLFQTLKNQHEMNPLSKNLIGTKLMYFGNTGSLFEFQDFCQKKGQNISVETRKSLSFKTSASKRAIVSLCFMAEN